MSDEAPGREITLDELVSLRDKTQAVSKWLLSEVEDRLDTLRPLLLPKRLLGDQIRGSSQVQAQHAEQTYDKLKAAYAGVAGEPLRLPGQLESPVEPIPNKLVLYPWEYTHELDVNGQKQQLTIRSPTSWVLMHAPPIGLSEARQMFAGKANRSDQNLRKFAVHVLVMGAIFDRSAGLSRLLGALRFRVDRATAPETGKLSFVRLTSEVPSFRPSDAVISNATRLSGVSIFEELVDVDRIAGLEDPLRKKIAELIA
jgi:hypothetical protein